jgi:hypothetical protein
MAFVAQSVIIGVVSDIFAVITLYFIVKKILSDIDEIRFRRVKKVFFKKLRNKMRHGAIESLEDVTLVKNSIAQQRRYAPLESGDAYSLLVEYLDDLPDRDIKSFRLTKSLINQALAEKPLSILPENELKKAKELKEHIKSKDEVLSRNFEDLVVTLGTSLQTANAEIKSARLNYRLTIISIIIGVASILIYFAK